MLTDNKDSSSDQEQETVENGGKCQKSDVNSDGFDEEAKFSTSVRRETPIAFNMVTLPSGQTVLVSDIGLDEFVNDSEISNIISIGGLLSVEIKSLRHDDSADALTIASLLCPSNLPQLPTPFSSAPPLSEKFINAKHIYKTGDSFRVQMCTGKKPQNKKFSRNVRSELDALWLCEYALIFVDAPSTFDRVLHFGNYFCFTQRNIVSSPQEFGAQLNQHLPDFAQRGLLKDHEHAVIANTLASIVPRTPAIPHYSSYQSSQQQSHINVAAVADDSVSDASTTRRDAVMAQSHGRAKRRRTNPIDLIPSGLSYGTLTSDPSFDIFSSWQPYDFNLD
jgi:hypothetical protein